MRYEKGHKESTRQRIVEVASRRFREDGVAAAGLAGLMADAGLTNGAFYAHFDSKDDLVRDALHAAFDKQRSVMQTAEDGGGLEPFLREYLSPRHRDNPGRGCAAAALAAEVARQPARVRGVFTDSVTEVLDQIARLLPTGSPDARRKKAIALYGLIVGTLQLARAVNDKALSDEILDSGLKTALALLHPR